ncbi:MAG: molecular chaperone [Cyanobacteria bacterium RYN_339]|nr:molecular chaperone [Cyanobacteria bacterium RYN_339]
MAIEQPSDGYLQRRIPASPASLESLLGEIGDDDDDIFGNRVEWKFVLSPDVAMAVRAEVAQRLHLEEFIPGRKKTIMHSVYFDSDDFMLYRRALVTESSVKFRLRTYTTFGDWTKMDPQGFFECKIGQKGKKFKLRSMLPVVRAADLMIPARQTVAGTGRLSMPGLPTTGRLSIAADSRFMWKARRVLGEFHMTARLTVSYVREAFVSDNGALRVTFDEHYRAAPIAPGGLTPLGGPPGTMDQTIVEVKFLGGIPDWLAAVMDAHGLPLGGITFSKFRQGVALSYPELADAPRT